MSEIEMSIRDFEKIDLRVGQIMSVEGIDGEDNLFKLKVDIGEEKQIVVSTKPWYFPEQLEGKKVIVFSNLKTTDILGVESQGMLLVAEDKKTVSLLTVDKDIDNGTKIM